MNAWTIDSVSSYERGLESPAVMKRGGEKTSSAQIDKHLEAMARL
jgi:hypothetical protein